MQRRKNTSSFGAGRVGVARGLTLGEPARVGQCFGLEAPILLVAVFMVNVKQGFFTVSNNLEFELSLIVLILLVVFLIYGSGKWSVDHWMKMHPNE